MEVDSEVAGPTAEVVSHKRKCPCSEGGNSVRVSIRGGNDTAGIEAREKNRDVGK